MKIRAWSPVWENSNWETRTESLPGELEIWNEMNLNLKPKCETNNKHEHVMKTEWETNYENETRKKPVIQMNWNVNNEMWMWKSFKSTNRKWKKEKTTWVRIETEMKMRNAMNTQPWKTVSEKIEKNWKKRKHEKQIHTPFEKYTITKTATAMKLTYDDKNATDAQCYSVWAPEWIQLEKNTCELHTNNHYFGHGKPFDRNRRDREWPR